MTKLFEHAVDTIRSLPSEQQDALARLLLQLAGEEQPHVQLSQADAASLQESLAQAARGDYASDDAVRAVWAKHGF